MKSFIFLLFFIFLCNFVSSIELSISPSQIDFNAKTNQESCKEITISTIKNSILIGSDRWAEKNIVQRNFFLHNLSSKDLDIKIPGFITDYYYIKHKIVLQELEFG